MPGPFFFALALAPLLCLAWQPLSLLHAPSPSERSWFGDAVRLSADGRLLVAGATARESPAREGSVHVFSRQPGVSQWTLLQTLQPPPDQQGLGGAFGISVSISPDARLIVVGDAEPSNETVPGAAHVFERVSPSNWTWIQALGASNADDSDGFGCDVHLSPDESLIAVGARYERSSGDPWDNSLETAGAVYVFSKAPSGLYSEVAYLKPQNPVARGHFGTSVDVPDNQTVVVGSSGACSSTKGVNTTPNALMCGSGAVYIFELRGASWIQTFYFKASNTNADDSFGDGVALVGDVLAISAPGESSNAEGINGNQHNNFAEDCGAVYIFSRSAGGWSQTAYIKPDFSATNQRFGSFVALSADATTLIAGAVAESSSGSGVNPTPRNTDLPNSGGAYIFKLHPMVGWQQEAFLKAESPTRDEHMGWNVGISGDGMTVAVNAEFNMGPQGDLEKAGAVYTFAATTSAPTNTPTLAPTTAAPTSAPTSALIGGPTSQPTSVPTGAPTPAPTTSAPTFAPTFTPGQILAGDTVLDGDTSITTTLQVVTGTLTVNGDLNLLMGSNLTLSNATITSTGAVQVSGPITLQLSSAPMDGDVIQLVSGASVSGQFSEITAQSDKLRPCEKIVLTQQNPQGNSLSAIASVDSSACGLPIAVIVGIAVGVFLLALLIVILIVVYRLRKDALFTDKMNAEFRDNELQALKNG